MTTIKNQAKKAVFDFDNYEIVEFSFVKPKENIDTFSIAFNPKGIFNTENSTFEISLGFASSYEDKGKEEIVIRLTMVATFRFEEAKSLTDIPDYFYRNSLGILFPYIRAFVSTLTFQANITPPMILPILNLTQIEGPLRDNITVI